MLAIKHILFPMDFSDRCRAAVPFVSNLATRFGAKITLISAAQPFAFAGYGDPGGPMVVDPDELLQALRTRLDDCLVEEFKQFEVERIAELGDPAQTILDYAQIHGVELIMMPTHGYGPFRSMLVGSVTAKVLHDAACPVWTAAHIEEAPALQHLECRNILCAIDATPKSVPLMKWSVELSKSLGASLRLVHVIRAVKGFPSRETEQEVQDTACKEVRQQITRLQAAAGVEAPLCVAAGDVTECIREEARRHAVDLVLIARGTLHETMGRLRNHSYGIIRSSPVPVISV